MTDDRATYETLSEQAFTLYGEHRYGEAVELVRAAMPELPGWRSDLAHLAACLLGVAGQPAAALAELTTAYDAGGWWHRRILEGDDDLAGLRDLPAFAVLVERAHARVTAADPTAPPPRLLRPVGAPRGLVVALHGAGQDAGDAVRQWRAAVDADFLLLAADSSQRNTPTYRSWPDPVMASQDIAAALDTLDPADRAGPLVTAGFSAGGRQAILWAIAGQPRTPVGFLAVAPAIGPRHLNVDEVARAAGRGIAGVVVLGDQDDDVRDEAVPAIDQLRAAGLTCRLDAVAGLGHDFPPDFGDRLPHLLTELVV